MPKAKIKKRKEKTVSVDKNELKELKECKAIIEEAEKQINGAPAGNVKDNDYTYFADFDKGSSIPAWSLPRNIDILESDVNKLGNMLDNKQIPIEEIPYQKADYEQKKKRLDEIKDSKPKLTGRQKDNLKSKRDELAVEINRAQFTRLEMDKGLADPHEEARRMSEPCIRVDKEEARRMGVETDARGYVSRSKGEAMWKNMSSLLGDTVPNPNVETLRSDSGRSKRNSVTVPVNIENGKVVHGE